MNILYTFNGGFLPQIAASVTSVCRTCKKARILHFYMMTLDVPEKDLEKLKNHIHSFETDGCIRRMTVIPLPDLQELIGFSYDTTGWNPIVLARLLLDPLLPQSVHRILYLDGDTIVRHSLAGLWKTDLKGMAIGACMEPTCDKKRKEGLGLGGLPYYNAGVLLVDLDLWRRLGTGKEILAYYQANGGRLFANDQDAINGSQKGKIYSLSFTYNYHNSYDYYSWKLFKNYCDYPIWDRREFQAVCKDPCIIHYLGEERPWRIGNRHRFRKDYLTNLNAGPWKGQGFERGWQLYFLCFGIFNFCMKPFPVLRLKIMNTLIPMMLKIRAVR